MDPKRNTIALSREGESTRSDTMQNGQNAPSAPSAQSLASTQGLASTHGAPASPCIRHCCLDLQDVCVGCGRSIDEITGWQRSSDDEKRAILARCQQRLAQRAQT